MPNDLDKIKPFLPPEPPPSAKLFGFDLVHVDLAARTITIEFIATEQFLNPIGLVQGGVISGMLDDAMGVLGTISSGGEKFPITTDLHTQFFKGAKPGKLIVEARVTKMGRSTVFTAAELKNEESEILATAIQTAKYISFGDAA